MFKNLINRNKKVFWAGVVLATFLLLVGAIKVLADLPTNPSSLAQYGAATTTGSNFPNGYWSNNSQVNLFATSSELEKRGISLYYQFVTNATSFNTSTDWPASSCDSATAYGSCSSYIWRNHLASSTRWYDITYRYRTRITAKDTTVDADLTNFPAYVNLANLGVNHSFWTNVRTTGGDILITNNDGTRMPVEVVSINTTGRTGEVYFRADLLENSTSTYFWIYYGSSTATQPASTTTYGARNVWSNGYRGVWHLNQTAGARDSTSYGHNSASVGGTPTFGAAGKLGTAVTFNGTSRILVATSNNLEPARAPVFSAWVNRTATQNSYAKPFWYGTNNTSPYPAYGCEFNNTSDSNIGPSITAGNAKRSVTAITIPVTTWTYLVGSYDGLVLRSYVNGVERASTSYTGVMSNYDNTNGLGIGDRYQTGQGFTGSVDELRIASTTRTRGWITTEYTNMNSPQTFWATSTQWEYIHPADHIKIPSVPDGDYKWQVLARSVDGPSAWVVFNASTPNIRIDTVAPTTPGVLVPSASSSNTITLNFPTAVTETNFQEYKIFYRVGTTTKPDETNSVWSSSSDADLSSRTYNATTNTTVTGLATGTAYAFNIWAYDLAGNKASSTYIWERTNRPPVGFFNSAVQRSDGTGRVDVSIDVYDHDWENQVRTRIDYFSDTLCRGTPNKATIDSTDANTTSDFGDPKIDNDEYYQIGSSTGYILTSSGYNTVNFDWLSQANLPSGNGTYCLRAVAVDNRGAIRTIATTTLTIDNLPPSTPNVLVPTASSTNSITLNFPTAVTETNFQEYKIFYRVGTTTKPDETNSLWGSSSDADLSSRTYNATTNTVVTGLATSTAYAFNIWAYDNYGNKASSTFIWERTNRPPLGFFNSAAERTDGTGRIDLSVDFYDHDGENQVRARIDYFSDTLCHGAPNKATIDIVDANTTADFGDPKTDNSEYYQIGSSTGYILTSSGYNTVNFDWMSQSDIPNVTGTYCLRVTAIDNRSTSATIATTTLYIDNLAPTSPGNLTLGGRTINSITTTFGSASTETNFAEYKIFYKAGSGVTENDSLWGSSSDADLSSRTYNATADTTISPLTISTQYYFNIWAYDLYGNKSNAAELSVSTKSFPANATSLNQYTFSTSTAIVNGSWYAFRDMNLYATGTDPDSDNITLYYQLIDNSSSFVSATSTPVSPCLDGASFSGCTNKIWTNSGNVKYVTVSNIPDGDYKWSVLSCDTDGCADIWTPFNVTIPNFRLDATAPASLNGLVSYASSTIAMEILFPSAVTENNFAEYKIYYHTGSSTPVLETNSTLWSSSSDANLSSRTFNGAASTTITGLTDNTWYSFAIYAYDLAGNKASSTVMYDNTKKKEPPLAVFNSATERTDGSGVVDISIDFSDPNGDEVVRAYLGYDDVGCHGIDAKAFISSVDGDTTADFSDPKIDNDESYQIGSSTGWITTYYGPNTVNFDWLSKSNLPSGTGNYCLKVVVYDGELSYTATTSVYVDNSLTSLPGNLTLWGRETDSITLNFGAATNDVDFSEYKIFYKIGASGVTEGDSLWGSSSDAHLASVDYGGFGSTTITGLLSGTRYVFNIWAYDAYSNKASATTEFSVFTRSLPILPSSLAQYGRSTTTALSNVAWINYGEANFYATSSNFEGIPITLYYEFIANASSFTTATSVPPSVCSNTTAFNSCSSKIWSNEVNVEYIKILSIPDGSYKWQVMACDDNGCSDWRAYNQSTPNLRVDGTNPTAPGVLTPVASSSFSVTLSYGSQSVESNFQEYKIYYHTGSSTAVLETNSTLFGSSSDANLALINYGGYPTTNITGLDTDTWYSFAIYVYDFAGNKASSTVTYERTKLNQAPTIVLNSAGEKVDGSGAVDVSVEMDDPNNDDTLRALLEYDSDILCHGSAGKGSIDSTDANTAADFGDPKVDNDEAYPIGSSTGYILTSQGSNTVNFDWLSKNDLPSGNGAYCIRVTVFDGDATAIATTTIAIDNVAPTAPGNLTVGQRAFSSITLNFGSQSTETNFAEYKIFYRLGNSGVTEGDSMLGSSSDSDLSSRTFNSTTNTTISGLVSGSNYVFNIWAYDNYGNKSYAAGELLTSTIGWPSEPFSLNQYGVSTSTLLSNGLWYNQSTINLYATSSDTNDDYRVVYYEFISNGSTFTSATTTPASFCFDGTAFNSCSSKIWGKDVYSWYDRDYSYRTKITANATYVDGDLVDFPVYLSLSTLGVNHPIWSKMRSTGGDLLITNSSGVRLPIEIVSVSTTNKTGEVFFKADLLENSTSTDFYLYYGSSTASQPASTTTYGSRNVWSNEYAAVWHLGSSLTDSVNGIVGTNNGATVNTTVTKIGDSSMLFVSASAQYINFGNPTAINISGNRPITIQGWVRYVSLAAAYQDWFTKGDTQYLFQKSNANPGTNGTCIYDGGWKCVRAANAMINRWYYQATTYTGVNGGPVTLYIDGVASGTPTTATQISASTYNLYVGGNSQNAGRNLNGYADEIRISSTSRSSTWISTEYNNQNSPATFFSTSTEQDIFVAKYFTIPSLPDSSSGYKWRAMSCDYSGCSDWVSYNVSTPNVYIDTVNPTNPGVLSPSASSTNSITLNFPAAVTEANFAEYKIFYRVGTTTKPDETNFVWSSSSDADLSSRTFNSTAGTDIAGLATGTSYAFNIWAYDLAGNKASSTYIYERTDRLPSGSFASAAKRIDDTGSVRVNVIADDSDGDGLVGRVDYFSDNLCHGSPNKATLDTTDASTTAVSGDPKIDNDEYYQIGSSTGYILTSSGQNSVVFNWLSKTDLPSANGTYCLRLTLNDRRGGIKTVATTTLSIDNVPPVVSSVYIANGTHKIGSAITITINADAAGYSLGNSSTVNGKSLSNFVDLGNNSYTVVYTVVEGDTDRAAGMMPINIVLADSSGNLNLAFTSPSANTASVDATRPTISSTSFNPSSGIVRIGYVATSTITAGGNEIGLTASTTAFTINGKNVSASFVSLGGGQYRVAYTVVEGDADRLDSADLPINFVVRDTAGNYSLPYTTADSANRPGVDANKPTISSVVFSPSSGVLRIGSTTTATITAGGNETGLVVGSTMTINGVNVASTFTELGGGQYRVTYTVVEGNTNRLDSADLPINFRLQDGAGNQSNSYTVSDAANRPGIDATRPTISSVSFNPSSGVLKVGASTQATITAGGSELNLVASSTMMSINGKNVASTFVSLGGGQYRVTYTVADGDNNILDSADLPVALVVRDISGNSSLIYNTADALNRPGVDTQRPVINSVSFTPSSGVLKIGDTATATIVAAGNETGLTASTTGLLINGKNVASTFVELGGGQYRVVYVVAEGDGDVSDAAGLSVNLSLLDGVGNSAVPFTTADGDNRPGVDANRPTISSVSFNPSSGLLRIGASASITITAGNSETGLSASTTLLVNGKNIAGTFSSLGGGQYRVTYTVVDGDTDISDSLDLPVSLQLSDAAGNRSLVYNAADIANRPGVDAHTPSIINVSFAPTSGYLRIGQSATITITAGNSEAGLLASTTAMTVNGRNVSGAFTDLGGGQYRVIYTVASGDSDIPDANDLPVSFIMTDAAYNQTAVYNTADAANRPGVDANAPSISSVSFSQTNGLLRIGAGVDLTITANNNETGLTASSTMMLVNGRNVSGTFVELGGGQYRITYTVIKGDTDISDAADLPISLSLVDLLGNSSAIYTTANAANRPGVDAHQPVAPGNLVYSSNTNNSITFDFGSASSDTNFDYYTIYYKVGVSGVGINDSSWSSSSNANLGYANYNGAGTITISGLSTSTDYVFRIYAYDSAGNSSSSAAEVTAHTNKSPSAPYSLSQFRISNFSFGSYSNGSWITDQQAMLGAFSAVDEVADEELTIYYQFVPVANSFATATSVPSSACAPYSNYSSCSSDFWYGRHDATWWNDNYHSRQEINFGTNHSLLPIGYTASVAMDTRVGSTFVLRSNGDDIRIVWQSSSTDPVEIDRISTNGWNNSASNILFKLQSEIAANGNTDDDGKYYIYYSYSSAVNPPINPANIYAEYDDFNGTSLGAQWTTVDKDLVSGTSFSVGSGLLNIAAGGTDTWTANDEYGAIYQSFSGDFEATLRITSQGYANDWSKAGIMVKDDMSTTAANDGYTFMVATPANQYSFQYDATADGYLEGNLQAGGQVSLPACVRLIKSGTDFSGYYSTDCSTFTQVGTTQSLTTADATQHIGIGNTSHAGATLSSSYFDYIMIKANVSNPEESSLSDMEANLFTGTVVNGITDSSTGYKWQVMACSDKGVCSDWVRYNDTIPNLRFDSTHPTAPGAISIGKYGSTFVDVVFGSQTSEANFAQYKVYYKTGLNQVISVGDLSWGSSSDSDLSYINFNGTPSTTIDVLAADTQYTFAIFAFDAAGNYASSTIVSVTTGSSANPPTGYFNSVAQKTDGTGAVDISIEADDLDNNDTLRARIDYSAGSSCSFASPLDPTLNSVDADTTADYGDPKVDNDEIYQVGSSTGWILTSPGSNTVNFDWLSKTDVSSANGVYCLRLTLSDGTYQQTQSATTTVTLDNLNPTTPGPLSLSKQEGNDIELYLGATSTETNFYRYRIFYKRGYGGVTESDTEHADINLNNVDFNGVTTTTISGLVQGYTYTINIWAYDIYGNKSASNEVQISVNKPPVNPTDLVQEEHDGVSFYSLTNGAVAMHGDIHLSAYGLDVDSTSTHFYFQVATTGEELLVATTVPLQYCASTTPWNDCSLKIWGSAETLQETGQWYDASWLRRSRITIDKSKIRDDYLSFPVAIASGSSAYLMNYLDENASDIVFTASDGITPIPFEREFYSSSTGRFAFWVKTDIASDTDEVIYAYYDNPYNVLDFSTTTFWSTAYAGVWHLSENGASSLRQDRSLYANNATAHNYDGDEDNYYWVDGTDDFDGVDDYLSINDANSLDMTGSFSLALWFNPDTVENVQDLTAAGYTRYQIVGLRWNVAGTADCTPDADFNPAAIQPYAGATYGNSSWLNGSTWAVYDTSLSSVYGDYTQYSIDFDTIWGGDVGNSEVYMVSYLYSPREKQVTFSVGSDDTRMVWINGHLAHQECVDQGLVVDDQNFNYTLKQGWNTFIMRVSENAGGWGGQWRVSSTTQGMKYTANPRIIADKQSYQLSLKGSYLSGFYGTTSVDCLIATGTWQGAALIGGPNSLDLVFIDKSCASTTFSGTVTANNQPLIFGRNFDGKLDEIRIRSLSITKNLAMTINNLSRPYAMDDIYREVVPKVQTNIELFGIPDSSSGYKWQVFTCDSKGACSDWVKFDQNAPNFYIDSTAPTTPGPLTIDGQTANSITLNFGSQTQDTFFNEYRVYYKVGSSGVSESNTLWGSSSDADLNFIDFNGSGSTTVTGLANGTQYVFNIWAYDQFGRKASASAEVAGYTNFAPTSTLLTAIQRNDGSGRIDISASFFDQNGDGLKAKLEYGTYYGSACVFAPAQDLTLDEADYNATSTQGDAKIENDNEYQIGNVSGMIITSGGVNMVSLDWLSVLDLPSGDGNYCLRLKANDGVDDQISPATTTVIVDNVSPTKPGVLTFARRSSNSITLAFGNASSDTNFYKYRLLYKQGVSPITELNSLELVDSDLDYINYNGTATTSVGGLLPGMQYSFSLFAYDDYGHKSSSTQVTFTTNHLPLISFNAASQRTDGTGRADISIETYDINGDQVKVKVEYGSYSGGRCSFSSPQDPTLDTTDVNTTADFGDPKVDNSEAYQIGSSTGYVLTNSGSNTVNFDWLSGLDLASSEGIYCLRATANDGDADSLSATTTLMIDNAAPSIPGNLGVSSVNGDDVELSFGSQSTDTNFSQYKIFYRQGSTTAPTESDSSFDKLRDPDLGYINFNGTATTVITSLVQLVDYSFRIFAYDSYGNKSGSVSYVSTSTQQVPPATWREAEDVVDPTVSNYLGKNKTVRVRISIANLGDWQSEDRFKIQYVLKGSSCSSALGWLDVATTTAGRHFMMSDSENILDQEVSVQRFSNSEGYGFIPGYMVDNLSNISASTTLFGGQYTEMEYAFHGTSDAIAGVPYCFRVLRNGIPLDSYSRYPELTLSPAPTSTFVSVSQKTDGLHAVDIAVKTVVASGDPLRLKIELGTSTSGHCDFTPSSDVYIDSSDEHITATYGDPDVDNESEFQVGSTTGNLILSAFGENTINFDWLSDSDLGNVEGYYCLRSTAYDGYDQQAVPATTTVLIDHKKPSNPGDLTVDSKTSASVSLNFGTVSSDINFSQYKIFYREGSSGVTQSDSLWGSSSDPDLGSVNFNGTGSTTITGLIINKQYVFKIFAYDSFGNVSSSSGEITASLWSKKVPAEWIWYQDQYNETPNLSYGLNVTAGDVTSGQVLKLRMTFKEVEGITAINSKLRLQYSTYSNFSSDVHNVGEIGSTSMWTYGDGVDNDDDPISTLLITPTSTVAMGHNESGINTSNYDHPALSWAEWEFTVRNNGAATGTIYYFRAFDVNINEPVNLELGQIYPSVLTSVGSLSQSIQGISSGVSTEGVTTNVSTVDGDIDFGQLLPGNQAIAAQRFSITTNAERGYRLYVYSRSDFIGNNGAVINPVSSTNESPAAWPAVPSPSNFGYHSGDDTLSGTAPSRFAANNTYARFESEMKEIAYSAIPVSDDTFDLIFRTEIGAQQPAGDFMTSIVYILVPEF